MRRYVLLLMTVLLSLASVAAVSADGKGDTAVESAAMRCSAISLMHSTLTTPSPQFGQVMGEIAGLYAQVYAVQQEARTKQKLNNTELRKRRDVILTEISKGWPKNKTAVVRDAAMCNVWRIDFFSKLSEKTSEKEFQAALASLAPPPESVSKPEIDKWNGLTPQAVAIWAKIQLQASQKK